MCNDSSFNTTTWVLVITKWVRGTAQDPRWIKQILLFKKLKSQSRDTEVVRSAVAANKHPQNLRKATMYSSHESGVRWAVLIWASQLCLSQLQAGQEVLGWTFCHSWAQRRHWGRWALLHAPHRPAARSQPDGNDRNKQGSRNLQARF